MKSGSAAKLRPGRRCVTCRPDFKVARFNDGVEDIRDLQPGMTLEGTVSNVAAFGAFVDPGLHQDGLVHVSQLANRFINDAREVVRTGDVVKVKVLEVDLARKRVALTMKLEAEVRPAPAGRGQGAVPARAGRGAPVEKAQTAMAAALAGMRRR